MVGQGLYQSGGLKRVQLETILRGVREIMLRGLQQTFLIHHDRDDAPELIGVQLGVRQEHRVVHDIAGPALHKVHTVIHHRRAGAVSLGNARHLGGQLPVFDTDRLAVIGLRETVCNRQVRGQSDGNHVRVVSLQVAHGTRDLTLVDLTRHGKRILDVLGHQHGFEETQLDLVGHRMQGLFHLKAQRGEVIVAVELHNRIGNPADTCEQDNRQNDEYLRG